MIEVSNTVNVIKLEWMKDIFEQKSTTYNLRCGNDLTIPGTKTKKYGMWTVRFNGKC